MQEEIDIREYAPFFHDGSLQKIACVEQEIGLSICSTEISSEDPLSPVTLSNRRPLHKADAPT